MPKDRELSRISSRQHGVFTVEQATASGLTRRGIEDRERRGVYERLYPNVFTVAGTPNTWHRATMAAVLSIGAPAAASHLSAAFLWKMLNGSGPLIHVVTRRWDRRHRLDFRLHESLDLVDSDIVTISGIPTTTATRTIVDLGAVAPLRVERALEAGITSNSVTLSGVERFVVRVARRGRRGVGVIRPLLEARRRWDGATASDLEDLFRAVLDRWAVPVGVAQYEVHNPPGLLASRPDFAYPEHLLAVELDSEGFHMDRLTFRNDRRKQNQLELLGWRVLRYTWWDLVNRPGEVAAEVAAALSVPA
ncbi:MAG: type IV toxin-antitoxin system AbiEi family antitoxin domain-containing protein [Actinomycetia bacterium]|nr:type IV toxin-antitoxin system AbiEi family antitoxin domain-containing protein [Actinomycetes bacterium]